MDRCKIIVAVTHTVAPYIVLNLAMLSFKVHTMLYYTLCIN